MSRYLGPPTHVMRPNGAYYRFIDAARVERCKPDEARRGVLVQVGCKARISSSCKSATRGRVGVVSVIYFEPFDESTSVPKPRPLVEIGVEFGNSHEALWYHADELEVSPRVKEGTTSRVQSDADSVYEQVTIESTERDRNRESTT